MFCNDNGTVTLRPGGHGDGHPTFVNGLKLSEELQLRHTDRIVMGSHHVFRFNDPAARRPAGVTASARKSVSGDAANDVLDWSFALRELAIKQRLVPQELEQCITPVKRGKTRPRVAVAAAVNDEDHQDAECEQALLESSLLRLEQERVELQQALALVQAQYDADRSGGGDDEEETISVRRSLDAAAVRVKAKEQELTQLKRRWERSLRDRVSSAQREETIMRAVLLVNEANSYAIELGKTIHYELKLQPTLPSSSATLELDSELVVRVQDTHTGKTAVLGLEELADRVEGMRGSFAHRGVESSPSAADSVIDPFRMEANDEIGYGVAYLYLKVCVRVHVGV